VEYVWKLREVINLIVNAAKYTLHVRTLLEDPTPEACSRWKLYKHVTTDLSSPTYMVCIFKYFSHMSYLE